jgi:hypothetical protein
MYFIDGSLFTTVKRYSPKWWVLQIAGYLPIIVLGAWLIFQSASITTLDQGDYSRAIAPFLNGPADSGEYRHWEKPTMEWKYREPFALSKIDNSASLYFSLNAYAQQWVRASFSLPLLGIASKIITLVLLTILARRIATVCAWSLLGTNLIAMTLAMAYFMAHNVYLFNSLYQEHVFWLGLPVLLTGLLDTSRWRSTVWILVGATICGAAKTQFFYIPLLVLILQVLWSWQQGKSQNKTLIVGLFLAQIICAIPLLNNPYRALNFYHATYYGSYILASPQTQKQLDMAPQTERCIGSDRWGAVLSGKEGNESGPTITSCFDAVYLSTLDVLRPYLLEPSLLWKMWRFSKPALWTAQPFHNLPTHPYIITPQGLNAQGEPYPFPADQALLGYSSWREQHLTQRVQSISLLALLIASVLAFWKRLGRLPLVILFLTALLWSQIAIALMGEGFRDLGKHYAAAQLSYDLLVVLLGVSFLALFTTLMSTIWRAAPPDAERQ